MSAEIVIIIAGALLILLAVGDSLISKGSGLINSKVRTSLGVIGVLLIIYVGYSYDAVNLIGSQIERPELGNVKEVSYPVDKVQVISPLEGDSVSCRILTVGVYPDANENDIWVLLKPSDMKYYPQSDHTNTSYKRNGEWQAITRFGGDKAEKYEIIVYETDDAASQFFSSTILSWKEVETYPGLTDDELPPGAREVDRISVLLKENCRGVH